MASRLQLHEEFCNLLGNRNVYFNPPESVKMKYPCIRYQLAALDQKYADNMTYIYNKKYEVTVIDTDPDSPIYDEIITHFPMCKLDRIYIAENLYHFVITLYY